MGVLGLWSLLDPAGKPIPVESLENQVCSSYYSTDPVCGKIVGQANICVQVLAVDISIWLNQAVRGMRDKSGHAVPHAHLVLFQAQVFFYQFDLFFLGWTLPPCVQAAVLQDQASICL